MAVDESGHILPADRISRSRTVAVEQPQKMPAQQVVQLAAQAWLINQEREILIKYPVPPGEKLGSNTEGLITFAHLLENAVAKGADHPTLLIAQDALQAAKNFIANGIALGFIRMPDADTPDPAHATPAKIDRAIEEINKVFGIQTTKGS